MKLIKLVQFQDEFKPVVYLKKVFQICVRDWDDDCIMKDHINGVKIIHNAFSGEGYYDEQLIETLEDHPFNQVKQIEIDGKIADDKTEVLQKLVDEYYKNNL